MSAAFELPEELRNQTQAIIEELKAEDWSVLCKRPESASGPQRLAVHLHGPNGQSAHPIIDQQDLPDTLKEFLEKIRQRKESK